MAKVLKPTCMNRAFPTGSVECIACLDLRAIKSEASNAPSSSLEGWSVPSLFTSWLLPRQSHVSFSPGAGSGRPNLMVLPVVPRQMKHNPGMLERILERPSVENSLASGGSRKASLASDLPIAEEPKARVNGSSQTLYLRSAFLDVRLQDSPTGSEVQHCSCQTWDSRPLSLCVKFQRNG